MLAFWKKFIIKTIIMRCHQKWDKVINRKIDMESLFNPDRFVSRIGYKIIYKRDSEAWGASSCFSRIYLRFILFWIYNAKDRHIVIKIKHKMKNYDVWKNSGMHYIIFMLIKGLNVILYHIERPRYDKTNCKFFSD